ncbi:hypothetical protein RN001_001250 [Aquatica leii]|uniref:Uncharacterized protein n=1 Tax=Aquatica leii TaxID=1421715 RepID=A0AAN7PFU4_9COLE|nr:hypothetical protein RN001_001250 [Aquatica leii]
MQATGTRGKTICSKEHELINKVIEVCDMESANNTLNIPITKAIEGAAQYTGVSKRTIIRIRKEKATKREATEEDVLLRSPGKHRKRLDYRNVFIDNFDARIIREIFDYFYITEKKVPTDNIVKDEDTKKPDTVALTESRHMFENENIGIEITTSMSSKPRTTTEEEAKAALVERRRFACEEVEKHTKLKRLQIKEKTGFEIERQQIEEEQQGQLIKLQRAAE